jgi:LPXTG-motif cell wall-anchored protein
MVGFRFVALGYALLVFLIAPSWLAAEEEPEQTGAVVPAEAPAQLDEAVPTVPELPATAPAPADDAAEPAAEPAPEPNVEPAAEPAPQPESTKAEKKNAKEEAVAKTAGSASVTISDFEFSPDTVTVNEGDTVTWTNNGPSTHTATAEDGSFDTGSLRKGESGSATFTSAGTINYICTPHPFMKGKVVVQAASSGTGGGDGSGDGSSGGSDTGSSDDGSSGVAGEDTSSDDSSGLPDTGGEALSIALLGLATLGIGLMLRRREQRS